MELKIDTGTGNIHIGDLVVTAETTLPQVQGLFEVGNEIIATVVDKKVACRFAKLRLEKDDAELELSLRFENGIYVSAFLEASDKNLVYDNEFDYYGKNGDRIAYNLEWLRKVSGVELQRHNVYSWGVIGVGEDKSGQAFAFLHNQNNGLAL